MRTNGAVDNHMKFEPESDPAEGSSNFGTFLLGAAVGAVLGGALALIYAPAEGKKLRRKMTRSFEDIAEGADSIIQATKKSADKLFSEGRDRADEIIDRTREKADDILEGADRAIAEARRRTID
jgi:gas vesicle protein